RPVPAAARGEEEAAQGSLHRACQGGLRRLAGVVRTGHCGRLSAPKPYGIERSPTGLQQLQRGAAAGLGAVVANSLGVSSPLRSASAPSNRWAVATAHSSNVSRLLPSTSRARNAA